MSATEIPGLPPGAIPLVIRGYNSPGPEALDRLAASLGLQRFDTSQTAAYQGCRELDPATGAGPYSGMLSLCYGTRQSNGPCESAEILVGRDADNAVIVTVLADPLVDGGPTEYVFPGFQPSAGRVVLTPEQALALAGGLIAIGNGNGVIPLGALVSLGFSVR